MRTPTVLIADDDAGVRDALSLRFSRMGYSSVRARDGLEAMTRCKPDELDLAVLDHDMPNGDGRSLAAVLRRQMAAPILLLSGHPAEHFLFTVMNLPDVFFLPKPIDDAKLTALLRSCGLNQGLADS